MEQDCLPSSKGSSLLSPDQRPKTPAWYEYKTKMLCEIKPYTPFSQTLDFADDSVCWTNCVLKRSPDYRSARMCLQVLCLLLLSHTDLQHVRAPLKQQPGKWSFAGSAAHWGDFILAPTCEEFHFSHTPLQRYPHPSTVQADNQMPLGIELE